MRLLNYQSPLSYGIVALTFISTIYFNLDTIDGLSVENEINRIDDPAFINKAWDFAEDVHYDNEDERRSSQILSRKRRYLTFPSGSSFQLVYDLIIGVIDYTNYLILGVTSALAYQLPSEAPSEIFENFQTRINDGTIGTSRNDTIENIEYVDTKQNQTQQYPQKPAYITSNTNPASLKPQSSSYYTNNQFHPPMNSKYYSSSPTYYSKPSNVLSRKDDVDYYSTRQNPLTEWKDSKIRKVSPSSLAPTATSAASNLASKWSQWWNTKKRPYKRKQGYVRKQRIFPVFAKRSVDEHKRVKRHGIIGSSLTKLDQIHLRYHRSTRQDLYLKIEKYLETHNKNGHQCVLKALCETGQKSNELEPGTFVGEIMRAVFTIPESEDPVHNYAHNLYDEAHAHAGNCEAQYPLCPDSVWKADFVL